MLSKLTVANGAGADIVLHEDSASSKRQLIDAKGLVGVGPLRSSKRVRPQAHGSINETTFEEGRTIQLTGEVMSQVSIENALEEFRKISGVLLESLDNGGALMKWTEGSSGLKLQQVVTLDSECEPTLHEAAAFLQYPVSLFAEDPRAYSQTQTTVTGAGITGATVEASFIIAAVAAAGSQGLAIDGTFIYWTDSNKHSIGRAKLNGTSVEHEWVKTGAATGPFSIAVDAGHVYWGGTGTVGRSTLAGASIEKEWISGLFGPAPVLGVAVNASNIFFTYRAGGGAVTGKATIAGASVATEVEAGSPLGYSIALDSSFIYYGGSDGVYRTTLLGESFVKLIEGTGQVSGMAVGATFVYWTSYTGNVVGRAKVGGTEVKQTFYSGVGTGPAGLAANSEHLYWDQAANGNIGRSNLAGGPSGSAITVAQAGNRPTPLTFKINGPITDPAVVRESDGSRIALTGTVEAGNYVEVNTADRTVRKNGTIDALSMVNAQNTNWSAFAPLASSKYLLVATAATAATLEALYRSAYA